jgi:hypothetical protein
MVTRRPRATRKTAPRTYSAFDFIRIELPCPKCRKKDLQPLSELIVNDTAECRYCGNIIDISTKAWRTKLAEQAEVYVKIKPM